VTSTPAPEDVFLEVVQHPDRTVVVCSGEIDVRTAPELRQTLFDPEVVRSPLDSVGIGALVAARRWLTSRGTGLVLVCGETQPRRVLTMTGLHKVFDIALPEA
jgi:anti-sigma B factor antagonist